MEQSQLKKILYSVITLIVVALVIFKYDIIVDVFTYVLNLLFPFILGIAIAFIVNIPMSVIEEKIVVNTLKVKKGKRMIAYLLTLIVTLGIFAAILLLVIPELAKTISSILDMLPTSLSELQHNLISWINDPTIQNLILDIEIDFEQLEIALLEFVQTSGLAYLSSGIGVFSKVLGVIMNFFIGFVFSIYLLLQKETLLRQIHMILQATCSKKQVNAIIHVYTLTIKIFKNFFTGQFLEALILGGLFFVSMSVLGLPYALLIAIIISITALVPIFGAFLGCGIGILLIAVVNPMSALIFVILFLVLQQLEGNLIYPHVVGNSIGLPGIWVFVAVTLGAAIMGVIGMILFIPLSSIIYTLIKEKVHSKLKTIKQE